MLPITEQIDVQCTAVHHRNPKPPCGAWRGGMAAAVAVVRCGADLGADLNIIEVGHVARHKRCYIMLVVTNLPMLNK